MANDITIIIPVYNRAGIVGPTLDAVAAQTGGTERDIGG